jgi:hypothetical protein
MDVPVKNYFETIRLTFLFFAIALISCNNGNPDKSKNMYDTIAKNSAIYSDTNRRKDSASIIQKEKSEKDTVSKNRNNTIAKRDFLKEGYVKARVRNMAGLDGCGFLLILDNGETLEPVNLDKQFMQDGLKLWIRYTTTGNASICMAGIVVTLTAIEKSNEK